MKTSSWSKWRLAGFAATAVALVFTLACIDRPMKRAVPRPTLGSIISVPQSAERDVDLLFVIDNSGSMAAEQAMLQTQFSALMQQLYSLSGGLPNVHIGVTSTDLGTGMFPITYCEEAGGDNGRLLKNACAEPQGTSTYIIDVEPTSCDITKVDNGGVMTCSASNCAQANCDAIEPGTQLYTDSTGCPRCRNYTSGNLESVFSCVAGLGTTGCGFEQQLESMYKALDNNPANTGFLRENAFLGVVFITDEDDCSASNPQLFDNTQTLIDSPLGPLTSFRCFEFGITCKPTDSRTAQGPRTECKPREDPGALLHPVSRYITFLQGLKDPQMLVVAAIAGPTNGNAVNVGLDEYDQPDIQPSCTSTGGDAVPGIRIAKLIEAFNEPDDLAWAYLSICSSTFVTALEGIGRKIKTLLDYNCPGQPLRGCADVAMEFERPGDGQSCNDTCAPTCEMIDVYERGTANETKVEVPPCLEVCANGRCPGNTDRSLAYLGGHPEKRDPALPVTACWHIRYQEKCEQSNFAEVMVSRQQDPPPRSFSEAKCVLITKTEQLCNDGVDNDEDCLIDALDPDCQ
jgi:hypothetical protein